MDLATLERLATGGFASLPATELESLGEWCFDWCRSSGDSRFCLVGETLRALAEWWTEYDESGGVPRELVDEIETELTTLLPEILRMTDSADAALLAGTLREQVRSKLRPPEQWSVDQADQVQTATDGPKDHSDSIAELLYSHGAVTVDASNRFTFVSGLRSPVYVDNRRLISDPKARHVVSTALASLIRRRFPLAGAIVGIATGGVPWAAWVADYLTLPLLYTRSSPKDRGLGRQIEGDLDRCNNAVLVEDLITTGLSSSSAVTSLREDKRILLGLVSIFSYEVPYAAQRFGDLHVPIASLTGLSALLRVGDQYLSPDALSAVAKWRDHELPPFVPNE